MRDLRQVSGVQVVPTHRMEIVAGRADIDDLGHVSNIVYVRWIQEAAIAHSDAVGFDAAAYAQLGTIFVVRRHEVDYLRSAFAGDRLKVLTQVAWWRGASTERHTWIHRVEDGMELVRAVTLWAYVDAQSGRPRRIPPVVRDAFYGTGG